METSIANIGQLIYTDPSAAYRAIITTKELHDEYIAIRKTIETPSALGIEEREAITTQILLQIWLKLENKPAKTSKMETKNITTAKEIEAIKAINKFRTNLSEKRNDMKSVTYKTIQNFFKEMNHILEYEYFKFEAIEGTHHSYKVVDRLRYNDSYKQGLCVKMTIGSETYEYHTKQDNAAWNMNNFVQNTLKNGIQVIVEVRALKAK